MLVLSHLATLLHHKAHPTTYHTVHTPTDHHKEITMTRSLDNLPERFTPAETLPAKEITAEILKRHLQGEPSSIIAQDLNTDEEYVDRYIEVAFNSLSSHFTTSDALRLFLKYAAFQLHLIGDLDLVINNWKADRDPRGASAVVNAIKLKSDLYDKIYNKGRETGNLKLDTGKSEMEALASSPDRLKVELRKHITEVSLLLSADMQRDPQPIYEVSAPVQIRSLAGSEPQYLADSWSKGPRISLKEWAVEYARLKLIKRSAKNI